MDAQVTSSASASASIDTWENDFEESANFRRAKCMAWSVQAVQCRVHLKDGTPLLQFHFGIGVKIMSDFLSPYGDEGKRMVDHMRCPFCGHPDVPRTAPTCPVCGGELVEAAVNAR